MKRFKTIIITLSMASGLMLPMLAVPAQVAALQSQGDACNGLSQLGGTTCSGNPSKDSAGQDQIASIAKVIIDIISFITGIAAVILIVVGGVRFVTSGGDSQAAAGARSMIIYAIVGLAIVALSQAIVHFVLNAILNNTVQQ